MHFASDKFTEGGIFGKYRDERQGHSDKERYQDYPEASCYYSSYIFIRIHKSSYLNRILLGQSLFLYIIFLPLTYGAGDAFLKLFFLQVSLELPEPGLSAFSFSLSLIARADPF